MLDTIITEFIDCNLQLHSKGLNEVDEDEEQFEKS